MNLSNLKSMAMKHWSFREDYAAKAKTFAQDTWQYAKENPDDVMLAAITVALVDINDSVDDIEDMSSINTALNIHEFSRS